MYLVLDLHQLLFSLSELLQLCLCINTTDWHHGTIYTLNSTKTSHHCIPSNL